MSNPASENTVLARKLGLAVIGMFGFGFAMVPLYSLICDVTGINNIGSSGRVSLAEVVQDGADESRIITVEFDVTLNAGLDFEVTPEQRTMEIHPGKPYDVVFTAVNNMDEEVVTQAIPGVTPWQATEHFHKTECFCFTQQTLKAREVKEMPLRFVVTKGLPDKYKTITLSYTFMNTDRTEALNRRVSQAEG